MAVRRGRGSFRFATICVRSGGSWCAVKSQTMDDKPRADLSTIFARACLHLSLSLSSLLLRLPPIENPLMSDLLTHGVSILLLALLNCSNTVLVRGVYIDAEEVRICNTKTIECLKTLPHLRQFLQPDGQCVIFPVYYVRLFFQKERLKKQKRMQDMEKGAHHHIQHQSSLRQQLLKGHEKSPTIVPMNKITGHSVNTLISSSHPSALNHHPHQQYKISNSNNQSQLSVSSPCPAAATEETDDRDEEEESRLYRPLEQTDDSPLCLKEVDRNRINWSRLQLGKLSQPPLVVVRVSLESTL